MADLNDQTQNVSLHDEESDAPVTTTTIGDRTLLDVNAASDPTQYQLDTDIETTGTSVSTTDTELYSFTGAGIIDFISVNDSTSSAFEVILNIDGSERFRVSMSDLGNELGLTGTAIEPIWTQTANKQFRWKPQNGMGFSTSFSVEGRATTGTRTLKHLIMFRELIT